MKRAVLAGYRDWAGCAFNMAANYGCLHDLDPIVVHSPQELDAVLVRDEIAFIFFAGWSWILRSEIVDKHLCVGVHPSALPQFAGGSPIQHQILAGVKRTKATLFMLRPGIDTGEVFDTVDLDLTGHMDDVFNALKDATFELLVKFVEAWRDGTALSRFKPQEGTPTRFKRLKPSDSKLDLRVVSNMTVSQLWDQIRCREDPYPNAYVEDASGRLTFKLVEFEEPAEES